MPTLNQNKQSRHPVYREAFRSWLKEVNNFLKSFWEFGWKFSYEWIIDTNNGLKIIKQGFFFKIKLISYTEMNDKTKTSASIA